MDHRLVRIEQKYKDGWILISANALLMLSQSLSIPERGRL